MTTQYFPEVTAPISYEGPESTNPLAFKWYNPDQIVAGKPMSEHLKFAGAYWHTFRGTGADPFGGGVYDRPWTTAASAVEEAEKTLDAAFEFFTKMGLKYYCFHDRDIAPEGSSIPETNKILAGIIDKAEQKQNETGVKLLWGTANLFSHARYTNGGSTNPDPLVFAHGAAQVRRALDATIQLGGTGYVFWGGREGYSSLLNTNMKQEREQFAALLRMAVDYGRRNGFNGSFFIEPKPKEPSVHQYDFDAATVLGFLREFDLLDDVSLNIEANHATLAGHTFEHDMLVASEAGKLGSLDINRGNPLLGWDTDQFPTDMTGALWTMLILLKQGGLTDGGLNFDAKVRRGSFDTIDLFHAHIGGMDTFARGLLIADKIIADGVFDQVIAERYAGFGTGQGAKILSGTTSLEELEAWATEQGEPKRISGR
ncbi:xylose isomerase, partial [bacterium M21]